MSLDPWLAHALRVVILIHPLALDGSYSLYCAVIVKKVDAKTLSKVGINELLRGV